LLGPSIIFASPPFCTTYALNACLRARAKIAAQIGLVLAGAELFVLVALMIPGLFQGNGG
jgi:hypothetical protein